MASLARMAAQKKANSQVVGTKNKTTTNLDNVLNNINQNVGERVSEQGYEQVDDKQMLAAFGACGNEKKKFEANVNHVTSFLGSHQRLFASSGSLNRCSNDFMNFGTNVELVNNKEFKRYTKSKKGKKSGEKPAKNVENIIHNLQCDSYISIDMAKLFFLEKSKDGKGFNIPLGESDAKAFGKLAFAVGSGDLKALRVELKKMVELKVISTLFPTKGTDGSIDYSAIETTIAEDVEKGIKSVLYNLSVDPNQSLRKIVEKNESGSLVFKEKVGFKVGKLRWIYDFSFLRSIDNIGISIMHGDYLISESVMISSLVFFDVLTDMFDDGRGGQICLIDFLARVKNSCRIYIGNYMRKLNGKSYFPKGVRIHNPKIKTQQEKAEANSLNMRHLANMSPDHSVIFLMMGNMETKISLNKGVFDALNCAFIRSSAKMRVKSLEVFNEKRENKLRSNFQSWFSIITQGKDVIGINGDMLNRIQFEYKGVTSPPIETSSYTLAFEMTNLGNEENAIRVNKAIARGFFLTGRYNQDGILQTLAKRKNSHFFFNQIPLEDDINFLSISNSLQLSEHNILSVCDEDDKLLKLTGNDFVYSQSIIPYEFRTEGQKNKKAKVPKLTQILIDFQNLQRDQSNPGTFLKYLAEFLNNNKYVSKNKDPEQAKINNLHRSILGGKPKSAPRLPTVKTFNPEFVKSSKRNLKNEETESRGSSKGSSKGSSRSSNSSSKTVTTTGTKSSGQRSINSDSDSEATTLTLPSRVHDLGVKVRGVHKHAKLLKAENKKIQLCSMATKAAEIFSVILSDEGAFVDSFVKQARRFFETYESEPIIINLRFKRYVKESAGIQPQASEKLGKINTNIFNFITRSDQQGNILPNDSDESFFQKVNASHTKDLNFGAIIEHLKNVQAKVKSLEPDTISTYCSVIRKSGGKIHEGSVDYNDTLSVSRYDSYLSRMIDFASLCLTTKAAVGHK